MTGSQSRCVDRWLFAEGKLANHQSRIRRTVDILRRIRFRQVIDVSATAVIFCAAALILLRGLAPRSGAQQLTGKTAGLAVEDISAKKLVTTLDGAIVQGNRGTNLVLIEFSDFECPFCRKYYQETFEQVRRELVETSKIRYAFRHFPLEKVHFNAIAAARAAECAAYQGKFWEMRAQLFERQPEIGRAFWVSDSEKIGLQPAIFEDCVRKEPGDSRIQADQAEANRLGVTVTPTFLIGVAEGNAVRILRKIEGAHPSKVFTEGVAALTATVTERSTS